MCAFLKNQQIYERLRQRIYSGEWRCGYRLPGEGQLSSALGVARITLRMALQRLEAEHLVVRFPRRGTFVSQEVLRRRYLIVHSGCLEESDVSPYIIHGMESAARERGCDLHLCPLAFLRSLSIESFRETLVSNHVCGLFILTGNYVGSEPELSLFRSCSLPILFPHGNPLDQSFLPYPMQTVDFRSALASGLCHLRDLGHRRIGFISYPLSRAGLQVRGYRQDEYLSLLGSHGLCVSPGYYAAVPCEEGPVCRAVAEMMGLVDAPTALLCHSDFYAAYVYRGLRQLGLRIPGDVSVMGFCGYPGGMYMEPPLTTVDLDYEFIGREAVRMMEDCMCQDGNSCLPSLMFTPYSIVKRGSCAPAPPTSGAGHEIAQVVYAD